MAHSLIGCLLSKTNLIGYLFEVILIGYLSSNHILIRYLVLEAILIGYLSLQSNPDWLLVII